MDKEVVIDGIIIFCSDPRVGLWKFIKKKLIPQNKWMGKVGTFGGAVSLANQGTLPTEANFLLAQIHFALSMFPRVREIMVVGHDCSFYKQIPNKEFTLADKKNDVAKAAEFLRGHFPSITVTAFFAEKHNQEINFEKIS